MTSLIHPGTRPLSRRRNRRRKRVGHVSRTSEKTAQSVQSDSRLRGNDTSWGSRKDRQDRSAVETSSRGGKVSGVRRQISPRGLRPWSKRQSRGGLGPGRKDKARRGTCVRFRWIGGGLSAIINVAELLRYGDEAWSGNGSSCWTCLLKIVSIRSSWDRFSDEILAYSARYHCLSSVWPVRAGFCAESAADQRVHGGEPQRARRRGP